MKRRAVTRRLLMVAQLVAAVGVLAGCGAHTSPASREFPSLASCQAPELGNFDVITGPMSTAGNTFQTTLTFPQRHTLRTAATYLKFKLAVDLLIIDLTARGAGGEMSEHTSGDTVTSVSVDVHGPLLPPNTAPFNRTFNCLVCDLTYGDELKTPSESCKPKASM